MKIALILLVRNEQECLEIMLPQIPAAGPNAGYDEIVAVDGKSTDGSVDILEKHGVRVIAQSERGRGQAFQLAFERIDADAFLFFSPDGNEAIADLPKFREYLENGADVVIASRMMAGAFNEEDNQFFRFRKWANNAFNLAANILFRRSGGFITDSINGYRAITKDAARTLDLDASGYTIEYQMTIRAMKLRLNIVEFPTFEGERVAGETGAPSIPTGLRFIRQLFLELIHKI